MLMLVLYLRVFTRVWKFDSYIDFFFRVFFTIVGFGDFEHSGNPVANRSICSRRRDREHERA